MRPGRRIAAAIYDGLSGFEYGTAAEILGRDRSDLAPDWYEFIACRVEAGPLVTSHGMEVRPPGGLRDLAGADIVLIPGWRRPYEVPPEPFLDALRTAYERGARLMSICTGVFPIAHAGLLDGRTATTHWLHVEKLRKSFPRIDVREDAIYLHDRSGPGIISSSAGSAAGLDLCLAVVREDFGQIVANSIARRMVAPAHREGGQSQYVEAPVPAIEDESLGPALDWMLAHLDEPLTVARLARRFNYSVRTFQRRFVELTGASPHHWLVEQRVARARELLETSDYSIEQVASLSGLGSAANLRKHLAAHLATTPSAYRTAFRATN